MPLGGATINVASHTIKRLTPEEMDERCCNNKCFNNDEKWVRGHNKVCKHLFQLEIPDDNEDALEKEEPKISLLAFVGVWVRETVQVQLSFSDISIHHPA